MLVGVGGTLPLAGLGGGVADADPAGEIVWVGRFGGVKRGLCGGGPGVGFGEGGELEEQGGLDGVESGRVAIGFGGKLPIVLEGVDLGEIDVGDGIVGIEEQRLLELGDGGVVVPHFGVVQTRIEMAEDVLGI